MMLAWPNGAIPYRLAPVEKASDAPVQVLDARELVSEILGSAKEKPKIDKRGPRTV